MLKLHWDYYYYYSKVLLPLLLLILLQPFYGSLDFVRDYPGNIFQARRGSAAHSCDFKT